MSRELELDLESQQSHSAKGVEANNPGLNNVDQEGDTNKPSQTGSKMQRNDSYGNQKTGDEPLHSSAKVANAWEKCHLFIKDRDVAMCNAWRDELDKLLIFAGLFSATVTPFILESYKWLQPWPDATTQYLGFLTTQLLQVQNVTLPETLSRPNIPPEVTSSAIRINTFWFLSLILSLSAVLVGILCYQWLREFQDRSPNISHKEAVAVRQIKFKGFWSWHIPAILSALPLLLQAALVLFFGGILDLLWHRNHVVAAVATVAVCIMVLFLAFTTLAPTFQDIWCRCFAVKFQAENLVLQCPFKSTQSRLIFQLTSSIRRMKHRLRRFLTRQQNLHTRAIHNDFLDWMTYDLNWQHHRFGWLPFLCESQGDLATSDAINWMHNTCSRNADTIDLLDNCLADIDVERVEKLVRSWCGELSDKRKVLELFRRDMSNFRNTAKHRGAISIYFLLLHIDEHPALRHKWVKTVLKTYDTDSDAYQNPWLRRVLECVSETETEFEFEPESMIQAINTLCAHCVKHSDAIGRIDIEFGWKILRKLTWCGVNPHRSGDVSLKDINADHFSFACRISKTFQTLLQSKLDDHLAWPCARGIRLLLPRELGQEDILYLSRTFPEFTNIVNFIKFLTIKVSPFMWFLPEEWYLRLDASRDFLMKFGKVNRGQDLDVDESVALKFKGSTLKAKNIKKGKVDHLAN